MSDNSLKRAIDETLEYLNSDEAHKSLELDPYWPKWSIPWWRIVTLNEMGLVHLAPQAIIDHLVEKINSHFIKVFPFHQSEIPEGCDPYRHIPCHCALGGIYQALVNYGVDVDSKLPWIRPWFLRYQLADGGLNCDESVYSKSKKSSIMSTLPALEAIMLQSPRGLTEEELSFLDRGAKYLVGRRLVYNSSGEKLMSKRFLELCFPRFYEYDILRGLSFLIKWKELRKSTFADHVIEEAKSLLVSKYVNGQILNERSCFYDEKVTLTHIEDGKWDWRNSVYFPLLEYVGQVGVLSEFLLKEYLNIKLLKP